MISELYIILAVNGALWLWLFVARYFVLEVLRLHIRGALGLALPGVIILAHPVWGNERVLRHEVAHQRQMRRYSPLGAALILAWHYGYQSLRFRIREGRWPSFWRLWAANPLEREANEAMESKEPLPRVIRWRCKKALRKPKQTNHQ